jgi:hypothetical protein
MPEAIHITWIIIYRDCVLFMFKFGYRGHIYLDDCYNIRKFSRVLVLYVLLLLERDILCLNIHRPPCHVPVDDFTVVVGDVLITEL